MLDFTAEVDNHLLQLDSYKLELDRSSVYRLAADEFIYIRSLEAGPLLLVDNTVVANRKLSTS